MEGSIGAAVAQEDAFRAACASESRFFLLDASRLALGSLTLVDVLGRF